MLTLNSARLCLIADGVFPAQASNPSCHGHRLQLEAVGLEGGIVGGKERKQRELMCVAQIQMLQGPCESGA